MTWPSYDMLIFMTLYYSILMTVLLQHTNNPTKTMVLYKVLNVTSCKALMNYLHNCVILTGTYYFTDSINVK